MKNYLFIAAGALFMSSCNQAELDKSNQQKDSLQSVINERNFSLIEKDSSLNDFISYFNDVERNLDSISAKQNIIGVNTPKSAMEFKKNQKDRISGEIAAINNLMEENRKMIIALNRKLNSSSNKNTQLKKMIVSLNNQLAQKEIELTVLNENLTALNIQVAALQTAMQMLTVENVAQSQNISDKTAALHTAYYVIGKSSDLQDSKIIDKKGGLLGIGRTSKMNENVDNSKFIQIDYTQVGTIAINDDVKIVTTHPSDSYTLEKETDSKHRVKNLIITNPEKFWSASKYLVVVKG